MHFISRRTSWWQAGQIAPEPAYLRWTGGEEAEAPQNWVSDVAGQAQNGEVLVFVHGFNTSRTGMLGTVKQLGPAVQAAGFRGAVIAYDWPSKSEAAVVAAFRRLFGLWGRYRDDKATVNAMDDMLVRDLEPLRAAGLKIHILAHSMGAYMTTLALGHADGWLPVGQGFGEVLLGAADVDKTLLKAGQWGGDVLAKRAARVTHYHSREDDVLDVSGKIVYGGGERSGWGGLPAGAPGFENVDMAPYYLARYPKAERKIPFCHHWYLENTRMAEDIALTLTGKDAGAMPTRHGGPGAQVLV